MGDKRALAVTVVTAALLVSAVLLLVFDDPEEAGLVRPRVEPTDGTGGDDTDTTADDDTTDDDATSDDDTDTTADDDDDDEDDGATGDDTTDEDADDPDATTDEDADDPDATDQDGDATDRDGEDDAADTRQVAALVALTQIRFPEGSATMEPSQAALVDGVATLLRDEPAIAITITSYDHPADPMVSVGRAWVVRERLIDGGVDPARIEVSIRAADFAGSPSVSFEART